MAGKECYGGKKMGVQKPKATPQKKVGVKKPKKGAY